MEVVLEDFRETVLNNAVVSASGSSVVFQGFGAKQVVLLINVSGSVTGTSPTLQFTIKEIDPGDGVTPIGVSATGAVLNATGTQIVELPVTRSSYIQVTWIVTGAGATFNAVYATLINKVAGTSVLYDAVGNLVLGTAGSPGTAVLTVQGVSGGQPSPVSGTVTAQQTTAANLNATAAQGAPNTIANKWPVQHTDGTNVQPTMDTAARKAFVALTDGTNTAAVKAASTAAAATDPSAVVALSPNSPLPAGSNAIGTVTAAQATAGNLNATVVQGSGSGAAATFWYVRVTDGTNTMPTGDAISRPIFHKLTDGTNVAAVTASSALKIDGSAVTQPVSGTVTSNQGTGAAAGAPWSVELSDGAAFYTGAKTGQFPSALVGGRLDTNLGSWLGSTAPTVGSKTSANSIPIVIASDQAAIPVSQSGTWTVQQGTPPWQVSGPGAVGAAPSGNPLYIAGTDGANLRALLTDTSGRQMVVGAAASGSALAGNPVLVAGSDGANARSMRTDTDGTLVFTPRDDRGNIGTFNFGGDDRLRVGQESLLFFDTFEGGTVNNVLWTQSTSGMTQAQASSVITLNNANSTTSGNYSILTSTKFFFLTSEFPLYVQFKARLIPQTNAVIELGFGTAATTAAPTNGCFLRVDASGNMRAVINFNGTETTSATMGTLTSANYYSFEVFIHEDSIRIDIDNSDGTGFASVVVPIPATQAAPMTVSHIPVFARVYNSGTTGTAANILISGVSVQQLDLNMVATWEEQMAGTGRGAIADPLTGSQLQNFSNSAAPSTITTASLSNTTAAYTTLGGLFAFNTPAGAETDYLLFAYQVPLGFTLYIWTIQIGCMILGAQSSTNSTMLQWGLAVGSSAASLATGSPNPPVRQTIGFQQAPKTANVGDSFNPANLTYSPRAPLVCFSQKFVQIILRVVSGNATAGQINRGFVNIDGFLQ